MKLTSYERIQKLMRGETPDRVPFDAPSIFSQFRDSLAEYMGLPGKSLEDHYWLDVSEVAADHTPKPSLKRTIKNTPEKCISVNGFGEVRRERPSAYYWEVLESAIKDKGDLDRFQFDSPYDDSRYTDMVKSYEEIQNEFKGTSAPSVPSSGDGPRAVQYALRSQSGT